MTRVWVNRKVLITFKCQNLNKRLTQEVDRTKWGSEIKTFVVVEGRWEGKFLGSVIKSQKWDS